ncbi:FtsB family cell division protein [Pseudokordiimonas caeni]|uniref:FtsB family cell division protein n=1 Tax=Pseudokordiimonas caeni TaxID=2997908 RepID=UPI002810EB19|nr:septum formation initiator family protein [Pseudokordiimonas caeni]
MRKVASLPKLLGQSWITMVWLFLIAYFGFHAFQGDASLSALRALDVRAVELQAMAADVRARRVHMEDRIEAFNNQSLDPDLLEEEVRDRLGFANPDELVILTR